MIAKVRLGCKLGRCGGLSVRVVGSTTASRSVVVVVVSWTGGKAGRGGAVESYGSVAGRPAEVMVIMGLLKGFLDCTKRPSMVRYELGDRRLLLLGGCGDGYAEGAATASRQGVASTVRSLAFRFRRPWGVLVLLG